MSLEHSVMTDHMRLDSCPESVESSYRGVIKSFRQWTSYAVCNAKLSLVKSKQPACCLWVQ